MDRAVIGFCALAGGTIGGFVPDLWGNSSLSLSSLLFSVLGGIVGVWVGARLSSLA
jgi:uncharacterized membrane protein YeaQ/YmgE (transglycosylase-associated protein family)